MNSSPPCDQRHNSIAKFVAKVSLITLPLLVAWLTYTRSGEKILYSFVASTASQFLLIILIGLYVDSFLPGCLGLGEKAYRD